MIDGIKRRAAAAVRATSQRARRNGLAQRCSLWVLANEHRREAPTGPWARGCRWIARHSIIAPEARASTAQELVELFFRLVEELGVERFVEAGAKEAGASRRAAVGDQRRDVVAFEANPYTFRRFEAEARGAGVAYVNHALSDVSGPLDFFVRKTASGRPAADGQGSMLERSSYEHGYVEGVQVEAVTLDGFFAGRDGGAIAPRPIACWIDVEGAADRVLRGASRLLQETVVVMIEVEEQAIWDGQPWLVNDVASFLNQHGLVPVARDGQSRFQHNVVFVRSNLAATAAVRRALAGWRRGHEFRPSSTP